MDNSRGRDQTISIFNRLGCKNPAQQRATAGSMGRTRPSKLGNTRFSTHKRIAAACTRSFGFSRCHPFKLQNRHYRQVKINWGSALRPTLHVAIHPWARKSGSGCLTHFRNHICVEKISHEKSADRIISSPRRGNSKSGSTSSSPGIARRSKTDGPLPVILLYSSNDITTREGCP